jgi:aspartate ammonia-lyase
MMPVIAWNALHASAILREAMRSLTARCVDGIRADADRCRELLERSTAAATALSPYIGYAKTAELAVAAVQSGRTVRDLAVERQLLTREELDRILTPEALTRPGIAGRSERDR